MTSQEVQQHTQAWSADRALVAGLFGVAIAIGCLMVPVLHFISGPLGPFIGGWFAGNRIKAQGKDALVIAPTIGVALAIIVGGVAAGVGMAIDNTAVRDAAAPLGAFVLVYGTLLAAIGALLGGHLERGTKADGQRESGAPGLENPPRPR